MERHCHPPAFTLHPKRPAVIVLGALSLYERFLAIHISPSTNPERDVAMTSAR